MRDHDDELFLRDALEDLHDLHAGLRVKCARGLIGKNDLGVVDQRTRNGYALHLTARHLVWLFVELVAKAHLLKGGNGACAALLT